MPLGRFPWAQLLDRMVRVSFVLWVALWRLTVAYWALLMYVPSTIVRKDKWKVFSFSTVYNPGRLGPTRSRTQSFLGSFVSSLSRFSVSSLLSYFLLLLLFADLTFALSLGIWWQLLRLQVHSLSDQQRCECLKSQLHISGAKNGLTSFRSEPTYYPPAMPVGRVICCKHSAWGLPL